MNPGREIPGREDSSIGLHDYSYGRSVRILRLRNQQSEEWQYGRFWHQNILTNSGEEPQETGAGRMKYRGVNTPKDLAFYRRAGPCAMNSRIVRGLVEQMAGTIRSQSSPAGTTIEIAFAARD
jgi:hypothetical protein